MGKADKENETNNRRVVTPTFRVSYPHLFKAVQYRGIGGAKFSITMLFDKSKDISSIKLALKQAKIDAFGPDPKKWPKDLVLPVQDGDSEDFEGKEGYAGCWVVKASAKEEFPPQIVDRKGEEILNAGEIYPGCYARAQIFSLPWGDLKGKGEKGITFVLDSVQKVKDGENLGSRTNAKEAFANHDFDEDDDFGDDDDDNGGF